MNVIPSDLPGVVFLEPEGFADARGAFSEVFRADRYAALGIPEVFVQDNMSRSHRGVLRGLHLQHPNGQGKLVYAPVGEVFDVAVDVRVSSPNCGRAVWTLLSDANRRQVYIPPGFAHGFTVMSDEAVVAYKCTEYYVPQAEQSICWKDPLLEIPWPFTKPILSARDAAAPMLADIPRDRLPRFA